MEGANYPNVTGLIAELFGQLDIWFTILFLPILIVAIWGRGKYPLVTDILRASNLVIAIFGLYLLAVFLIGLLTMEGHFEEFALVNRAFGPYWYFFWITVVGCILIPQFAWIPRIGNSLGLFIALLFLVNANFLLKVFVLGEFGYQNSSWSSSTYPGLVVTEHVDGLSVTGRMFYLALLVGITLLLNRVLRKRSQGKAERAFDPMAYSTQTENPTTSESK